MTKLTHRALHKAFILSSHAPYDTSIFMVEGIATMVEGIATMVEGIATIVEGIATMVEGIATMGSDHKLTVERLFASP
jgi:methyl-accepting chemotaxis protein